VRQFIRIGIDLAKNSFQIHALVSEGSPPVTRKLRRLKMHEFFSRIEPCLIGLEACASRIIGRVNSRRWDTKRY
jgi:transposase